MGRRVSKLTLRWTRVSPCQAGALPGGMARCGSRGRLLLHCDDGTGRRSGDCPAAPLGQCTLRRPSPADPTNSAAATLAKPRRRIWFRMTARAAAVMTLPGNPERKVPAGCQCSAEDRPRGLARQGLARGLGAGFRVLPCGEARHRRRKPGLHRAPEHATRAQPGRWHGRPQPHPRRPGTERQSFPRISQAKAAPLRLACRRSQRGPPAEGMPPRRNGAARETSTAICQPHLPGCPVLPKDTYMPVLCFQDIQPQRRGVFSGPVALFKQALACIATRPGRLRPAHPDPRSSPAISSVRAPEADQEPDLRISSTAVSRSARRSAMVVSSSLRWRSSSPSWRSARPSQASSCGRSPFLP